MRLRELRAILQSVVIAGLPAMGGCFDGDGNPFERDCTDEVTRDLLLQGPHDPELELKIESCRMDADACQELCVLAMQRAGIGSYPETCKVGFSGDDVALEVGYTVYNGGSGCPVDGRRPAGLHDPRDGSARSVAGAWLAHAAWLEGASIYAFVHLARELEERGAPPALVRAALVAANDEVRHTTMMTRLAARYGAAPPRVEITPVHARSLEEIALENAVEGCVRETWGAVLALWQSRTAQDPVARATFAMIAADELRHAALAWQIDGWLAPQLSDEALARVAAAREAAIAELHVTSALAAMPELGLPDDHAVRDLVARTTDSLWTATRRAS